MGLINKLSYAVIMACAVCFAATAQDETAFTCMEAPVLCDINDIDGLMYSMSSENPDPAAQPSPLCPGNDQSGAHNITWVSFVAWTDFLVLDIIPTNCDTVDSGGQDVTGIQAGIYEDCDFANAIFCNANANDDTMSVMAPVTVGEIYHIFVDGFSGSSCDIEIDIINGGEPTGLDPPETINDVGAGGTIEVCRSSEPFDLTSNISNIGDAEYIFQIDGGTEIENGTNPTIQEIFDTEGTFSVCVRTTFVCDSSDNRLCVNVNVTQAPPEEVDVEFCEGETETLDGYTQGGSAIVIDENSPLMYSDVLNADNCLIDLSVNRVVFPENDENPTMIDTVLCDDELPFTLADGQQVSACGMSEVMILTDRGCDSFINYDITVLTGMAELVGDIVCDNGTYTIPAMVTQTGDGCAPATINYQWVDPDGNEIAGATDPTLVVTIDPPGGTYVLRSSLELNGKVCDLEELMVPVNTADFLPPDPDAIQGEATVCLGDIETYSVTSLGDDIILYEWTFPTGAAIIMGDGTNEITVDFSFAESGQICLVSAANQCGSFIGDPVCLDVEVVVPPEANAGDDQEYCGIDTVAMLNAGLAGDEGVWTVTDGPGNVIFSDPTDPASTITVDAAGVYVLRWSDFIGDCSNFDEVVIVFYEEPELGEVSIMCQGGSEYVVTIEIEGGAEPYMILDGGGTIDGSTYTSELIDSGEPYFVRITDDNGCGPIEVIGDTVRCNCTTMAGTMVQDLIELCADGVAQGQIDMDPILDEDDTTRWVLHDGSGLSLGTVFGTNDTGEFSFDDETMTLGETYYISFVAGTDTTGNGDIDLGDGCLGVAQGQPVIWYAYPTADAGRDTQLCDLMVDLDAVRSVGTGRWIEMTGPGVVTISDSTEAKATMSADMPGVYDLTWVENNNGCTDTATLQIEFYEIGRAINILTECNEAADMYTVTFEIEGGARPYTIVLGDGSLINDSTYMSEVIARDSTYEVILEDANGCVIPTVMGVENCICESEVGTMDGVNSVQDLCEDELSMISYNDAFEVYDADDTTSYVLHEGDMDVLVNVLEINGTGSFGFDPLTMNFEQVYYISAVVGDGNNGVVNLLDGCLAVSQGRPVVWHENPEADAGGTARTCETDFNLFAVPSIGSGNWRFLDGPTTVQVDDPTSATSGTTGSDEEGVYRFEWTENNSGCIDRDTVEITILSSPRVDVAEIEFTCNATNTGYTVRFPIRGGQLGTYDSRSDRPGGIVGLNYISGEIPSDSTVLIEIWDVNGCDTVRVLTSFECPCETTVGRVGTDQVDLCEDEDLDVLYNNTTEVRDGDDELYFVLHTDPGAAFGDILQVNSTGIFSFIATGMDYGTVYYASPILGSDDGAGFVDTSSTSCFDIGVGTPVVWYEIPVPVITSAGNELTCSDPEMVLSGLTSTPAGVSYRWIASDGAVIGGDVTSGEVRALAAGRYTLELTNGACVRETFIDIVFNGDLPTADAGQSRELSCAVTQVTLDGSGSDQGDNIEYEWTNSSDEVISDEITAMVSVPGTYNLRVLDTETGCPALSSVEVTIDTVSPTIVITDVGDLTCESMETFIDASGSASGGDIRVEWSTDDGEILSGGDSYRPTVSRAGVYTITVTDDGNGCSSSREVMVQEIGNTFSNFMVNSQDVKCFGEGNGFIEIMVDGGTGTVEYSINGGASFQTDGSFMNLGPGDYQVLVRDENGCELGEERTLVQPEELILTLPSDTTLEFGAGLEIMAEVLGGTNTGSSMVEWSGGDTTDVCLDAGCQNLDVEPIITTTYVASITDERGCTASDQIVVRVQVSRKTYVPNVFSPNGDGTNDYFGIFGQETVEVVEMMRIYDRWGTKVYEGQNLPPNDLEVYGWDGLMKGELALPGVYSWYAVVRFRDGFQKNISGDVTLIR